MSRKNSPLKPTPDAPHTILERRLKRGYRETGKVNLSESEASTWSRDLAEYEKWLKEIKP